MLHLARHRRPLALMLTQSRTRIVLLLTVLIAASFIVFTPPQEGSPIKQVVTVILRAPVRDIAPVLGISAEEAISRLILAGARDPAPSQSIEVLARRNDTSPIKRLVAVVSPPKAKREPVEKD